MPIVGFTKHGTAKLKTQYGPKVVGIINIRTSEREAAPQDNFFLYELYRENSIIKALNNLHPAKLETKEETVKLERKPVTASVIPAQAGIQEENNQTETN